MNKSFLGGRFAGIARGGKLFGKTWGSQIGIVDGMVRIGYLFLYLVWLIFNCISSKKYSYVLS